MRSWPQPELPALPSTAARLRLHDAATGEAREVAGRDGQARMYVCGITPYDATHLGHAATYLTFDLVNRALRAAGLRVRYAQNVTDVDDPLFERAARDGVDWRELGRRETQLFRDDMTALRVLPPDDLVGVEESMSRHVERVAELVAAEATYTLPVPDGEADPQAPSRDVYLDLSTQPSFGSVSHLGPARMRELFAEFGGDPERPGKRDPLDPLLWRGARRGEPSWPGPDTAGPGRPGWHLECTTIALDCLGPGFDLQGGGRDLAFPHHEMSAVQALALPGVDSFARAYAHQGMVAYDGAKMSKSLGNLVRVSDLRAAGEDPMAVRLVMLAHHYRQDWEYTDADLATARERLDAWRAGLGGERAAGEEEQERLVGEVAAALADDPGAPAAVDAVDAWVGEHGPVRAPLVRDAVDALLGVAL